MCCTWPWLAVVFALLGVLSFGNKVSSERIRDVVYRSFKPKASNYCFRRANGTHQFGCQTNLRGNVGVVHLIEDVEEVTWLIQEGPHAPYIAVFTPKSFSRTNIKRLQSSGKIAGVILLGAINDSTVLPVAYSDDSVCPNSVSSLYKGAESDSHCSADDPWNSAGSGLLFDNFDFPIVVVLDFDTTEFLIKDCYEKHNRRKPPSYDEGVATTREWPLCAVEIKARMLQAVNSETCMRRNDIYNVLSSQYVCDPLGDNSVFMLRDAPAVDEKESNYPNNSVLVLTTRLDTFNLFDKAELGDQSPVTGIITIIAVAELLSKTPLKYSGDARNIFYAFLHGESFDYIGSSRLAYDISQESFPAKTKDNKSESQWPLVNLNSLNLLLELGQVKDNGEGLFMHVDTEFDAQSRLREDMEAAAADGGVPLSRSSKPSRGLPPASIQSILKMRRNIPSIIISNFDQRYTNTYYHSLYDKFNLSGAYRYEDGTSQPLVRHLKAVTEMVAAFLYKRATGGLKKSFLANATLINELLLCYTVTPDCLIFNAASTIDTPPQTGPSPKSPYQQYVGVTRSPLLHAILTQRVLAYVTATQQKDKVPGPRTPANCSRNEGVFGYLYVRGTGNKDDKEGCMNSGECGYCIKTTSWLSPVFSPAFSIEGYNFSDPTYGAWTESLWSSLEGRIFMMESPNRESKYLACGFIFYLVSVGLVVFFDRNAATIFDQLPSTTVSSSSSSSTPPLATSHNEPQTSSQSINPEPHSDAAHPAI